MRFSFDGKGLNDATQRYKPRVATLTDSFSNRDDIGVMLEAAPDLFDELELVMETIFEEELAGHFKHADLKRIMALLARIRSHQQVHEDNRHHEMFLDYFNNFLSVERFAEYYEISVPEAKRVIERGREIHETGATKGAST